MKWIIGLFCLIFLVIFHEFGHFIAAKLLGIKVESFSVGFGPVLFHKTIKGTDYRLSLIPLGGYCGMKGEKDFQNAIETNSSRIIADSDSFYGVSPLRRAITAFAGPFANFIFSLIAFSFVCGIGYSYYSVSNTILIPEPEKSSVTVARDAGLQSGDKIIKIQNKVIEDFSDLQKEIMTRPDEDITVTVDRDGQILVFNLHTQLDKKTGAGLIGITNDPTAELLVLHTPKYSFFGAIKQGFLDTVEATVITFTSFKVLFKGVELQNVVGGPVRVTDLLGSSVQSGFRSNPLTGLIIFFQLMAMISISLGLVNLLPIPVMDGGLILISIIEMIIRRPVPPKIQHNIQLVGFAIVMILVVFGLTGDFLFFLHGGAK